jgi:hypothetical protein
VRVVLLLAMATLGSIVSTAGAGALLVLSYGKLARVIPSLVSFAAGTLLAGAHLVCCLRPSTEPRRWTS